MAGCMHIDHIKAAAKLALSQGAMQVFVHAFLDGRDTPPQSAKGYVTDIEDYFTQINQEFEGNVKIASIIGRFYAMDRDKRWDRVESCYQLLTEGKSVRTADNALDAIEQAYAAGETDEFIAATFIEDDGVIGDNDGVIFMNFRADRAREISLALWIQILMALIVILCLSYRHLLCSPNTQMSLKIIQKLTLPIIQQV